jgi:hypothetical protein
LALNTRRERKKINSINSKSIHKIKVADRNKIILIRVDSVDFEERRECLEGLAHHRGVGIEILRHRLQIRPNLRVVIQDDLKSAGTYQSE